ncbi:MAG: hypothetical protein CVV07_01020 [Gammaproteobacteria bacterium HGW-Gammaproteobacteria-11]|nr:MAG: hypothetical protein CVV07_01020 [Gammaproteobacteria bacterium HGW-Gammaproteobacteria-11]
MGLFLVLIVSVFIMSALTPKPPQPKPTAFEDIDFPQAEEGTAQSAVFGQVWSKGWMVLTVGNYRTRPIVKKAGKK